MVNPTSQSEFDLINVNISNLAKVSNLIIKGSESFIHSGSYLGKLVVIKERRPKRYRENQLDLELRTQRLRIESRMIKSALNNNINVPSLFSVDLLSFSMFLEHIKGNNLGVLPP